MNNISFEPLSDVLHKALAIFNNTDYNLINRMYSETNRRIYINITHQILEHIDNE